MNNLEIKKVPFMGAELMAARDADGQIWAGVRWMCDGIGLSKSQSKTQVEKINEDKVLSKGVGNFRLPTSGGMQDAYCLKLDFVPLWLAKISITPTMERETPELSETLMEYQLKAKDVLAAAFLPQYAKSQQPAPLQPESAGGVAQLLKVLRATMKDNEQPPEIISQTIKALCEQFGIRLPNNFVRRNPFEQMSLVGMFWGK